MYYETTNAYFCTTDLDVCNALLDDLHAIDENLYIGWGEVTYKGHSTYFLDLSTFNGTEEFGYDELSSFLVGSGFGYHTLYYSFQISGGNI